MRGDQNLKCVQNSQKPGQKTGCQEYDRVMEEQLELLKKEYKRSRELDRIRLKVQAGARLTDQELMFMGLIRI